MGTTTFTLSSIGEVSSDDEFDAPDEVADAFLRRGDVVQVEVDADVEVEPVIESSRRSTSAKTPSGEQTTEDSQLIT
jgi:hypothetical protein